MFDDALRRTFVRLITLGKPTEDREEAQVILDGLADEKLTERDEVDGYFGLAAAAWAALGLVPALACLALGAILDKGLGVNGLPVALVGGGLVFFPTLACLGLLRLTRQNLWARRRLRREGSVVLRMYTVPVWADALQVVAALLLAIALGMA